MKKKAQWSDIRKALLTVVILAIIVGYLIMRFILNPSSSIQTGVISPQAKEMCKQEMDKPYPPGDYVDSDGFPDNVQRMGMWCDSCLGGNDAADSDRDGIPDACDKFENTPLDSKSSIKEECKYWPEDMKRCFTDSGAVSTYNSKYPSS